MIDSVSFTDDYGDSISFEIDDSDVQCVAVHLGGNIIEVPIETFFNMTNYAMSYFFDREETEEGENI